MTDCRNYDHLNRKVIFDNLKYNNGKLSPMDGDMIYDCDHKLWLFGEVKHEKDIRISKGAWICLNRLFDDLDSIPKLSVAMYHAKMKEEDYPDLAKGIVIKYRIITPSDTGKNWEKCWEEDGERTVKQFMDDHVYLHAPYLRPY